MYFTRRDIEEGLAQLVAELSRLNQLVTIQVVGGAAITLQADRGILTNDVDALFVSDSPVQAAIERVAVSRNWPMDWTNNNVLLFVSHFDQPSDWEARFTSGEAQILIARPPLLLAMKLLAGRGLRDNDDIDLLLELCGITDLEQAVDLFDHYYPTEVIAPKALLHLKRRFSSDE